MKFADFRFVASFALLGGALFGALDGAGAALAQNQFGMRSPGQSQYGTQDPNGAQNQFGTQPQNAVQNQFWAQPQNAVQNQFGTQPQNAVQEDANSNPEAKALFAQAVHLLKINRAYQARQLLERASAIAPQSAEIHCNLGLAYQNSGNMQKALNEFKTALGINPNMPEAKLNLAGCFQSLGSNKDAITWYSAYLLDRDENDPQRKQINDIVAALQKASSNPGVDPNTGDYLTSVTADGAFRWAREKLPIKVYIQNTIVSSSGNPVPGFKPSFRTSLINAFEKWCVAANNRVNYVIVPDKNRADIYCTWTNDPLEVTDNGTSSERGAAKIIVKGNKIERATLKILTRPVLEDGLLSQDELSKACLHEVGHVLGLQGHSTNNHDVMFFTVDTATVWPVLTRRDKATIVKLYRAYPAKTNPKTGLNSPTSANAHHH